MGLWYYVKKGERVGPVTREMLIELRLDPETLVWCEGMAEWRPIVELRSEIELDDGDDDAVYGEDGTLSVNPGITRVNKLLPDPSEMEPAVVFCKKGSPIVFLVTLLLGSVCLVGWCIGLMESMEMDSADRYMLHLVIGFLVSVILLVWAIVVHSIALHRIWAIIQDGYARTTPGKAVGFLFIPFFNLYWYFIAYHGLAVDYNKWRIRHHREDAPVLSEGFFLACPIVIVCTFVFSCLCQLPGFGLIAMVPILVFFISGVLKHFAENPSAPDVEAGAPTGSFETSSNMQ